MASIEQACLQLFPPGSRLSWLPLGNPAFCRLFCLPLHTPFAKLLFGMADKARLEQDFLLLAEAWGLHGITMLTLRALQGALMERNLSKQLQQAIWCGFFSSTL